MRHTRSRQDVQVRSAKAAANWTTRLPPEQTRPYGVEELHTVYFLPDDWPGKGPTISLLLPECELQCVTAGTDGIPLVMVNRPRNKKIKYWLRIASKMAAEQNTCLIIGCDTSAEAERAAKIATRLLPKHQRAALERMEDPTARSRSRLS
jgi:hypothetical protein